MCSYDEEVQFCYLRRNEMVTLNALEEGDWTPPTPTQAQRLETLEQENSLPRAQIEAQSGAAGLLRGLHRRDGGRGLRVRAGPGPQILQNTIKEE